MESRKRLKIHLIVYLCCASIGCLPCVSSEQGEGERTSLFPTHSSTPICGIPSLSMSEFSFNEEMGLHGKSDSESQEDRNYYETITTSIGINMIDWKGSMPIQVKNLGLYQPETVASVDSLSHNFSQYPNNNHISRIIESSTSTYESETSPEYVTTSTRRTNKKLPRHSINSINASSCLITAEERAVLLGVSTPFQVTNRPKTDAGVGSLSSNSNFIEDKKEKKQKKRRTSKPSKTSKNQSDVKK